MSSNSLRHPGQGTQQPENDMDKERFKQQVIDIMREGEVLKPGNCQASEKEYSDALERRALRICREAEVPTLHKAVTTAAELKTWIQDSEDGTTFSNMQPWVLERFVRQSSAKTRAITSLKWLCNNLGFKWPLIQIEQPTVGRAPGALGMEAKQTPAAQPLMFNYEDVIQMQG